MLLKIIILISSLILTHSIQEITPRDNDVFDLQAIDLDGSRLIELSQFSAFIKRLQFLGDHYKPHEIEELTVEAFNMFDLNADRILEHEEYQSMVKHVGGLRSQHDQ